MIIVGGKFKGQKLHVPKGMETRPTSSRLRETVFDILQNSIEGATFLDLFAGSGAMGIEALSRGASHAAFVDSGPLSCACIKKNIDKFGVSSSTSLLRCDAFKALKVMEKGAKQFDIIFVDPPYHSRGDAACGRLPVSMEILLHIDRAKLLSAGGILLIEEGTELPVGGHDLENLSFKKVRKAGRAFLHEFFAN